MIPLCQWNYNTKAHNQVSITCINNQQSVICSEVDSFAFAVLSIQRIQGLCICSVPVGTLSQLHFTNNSVLSPVERTTYIIGAFISAEVMIIDVIHTLVHAGFQWSHLLLACCLQVGEQSDEIFFQKKWAESDFLTLRSKFWRAGAKFDMRPNGEHSKKQSSLFLISRQNVCQIWHGWIQLYNH